MKYQNTKTLTKGKNKNMLKVRKMLLQSFKCNTITYFSEVSDSRVVSWSKRILRKALYQGNMWNIPLETSL